MDKKTINARVRTTTGKGAAKNLRAAGRLPAVMYDGTGKTTLLDIEAVEFNKLFNLITESTLVDVKIEGGKDLIAFVKDVQYDIIRDTIGHVDLYHVDPKKIIRTKIAIKLTGTPPAVRTGGLLESGIQAIEVECLPRDLPERILVDVNELEANHSLHVRDIKVAPGVKILTDANRAVCTVKYMKEV